MLVEKEKSKCKKKLGLIFFFLVIFFIIILTFPFLLFLFIIFIYNFKGLFKSINSTGITNCIQELFFDKKRIIELIQKRKQKLKLKNERLSRERISKKIKD